MLRKQLELPPEVARAFVKDMRAYHAEPNGLKRDEIAARQVWFLKQSLPKGTKVRLADVKVMFEEMKDQV